MHVLWPVLDDGSGATAAGTDATGIYTVTVNGTKDARTATGRKLAELVWMVWTERRCYYGARHAR